jgi:hypothetical protein
MNLESRHDAFAELAPLFALGVLDADEAAGFKGHVRFCPDCLRQVSLHETVGARLGSVATQVAPPAWLRGRVLALAAAERGAAAARWRLLALAASVAAVASTGGGWLLLQHQRTQASGVLVDLERERSAATSARAQLTALQERLREAQTAQSLALAVGSRSAHLQGNPQAAPGASAFLVWHPARTQAILLVSGLPPAPAGRAYAVWVIAGGSPLPAGLFQTERDGRVSLQLPQLAAAGNRAFAVTLEPAGGVAAPSGPMVLSESSS